MSRLPHPSQSLDKWTLRGLTYAERQQARAARSAWLAAEREAQRKHKRTCQICGREIYAESGLIAHHGYTRPGWGYQTPSCWGARELPFERSRDALGAHIERLRAHAAQLTETRAGMDAELIPLRVTWTIRDKTDGLRTERDALVTRETFESVAAANPAMKYGRPSLSFDEVKRGALAMIEHESRITADSIEWQKGRFDSWIQVEGVEQ